MDCSLVQLMRKQLLKTKTHADRMKLIADISNHKQECEFCSGRYQLPALQQLKDQAYAGTWGNGK